MNFIKSYASDLLKQFSYNQYMLPELKDLPESDLAWIEKFNATSLIASKFNQNENENITSIMINYPALLLRKKS